MHLAKEENRPDFGCNLEALPGLAFIINSNGILLDANSKLAELLETDRDALTGRNLFTSIVVDTDRVQLQKQLNKRDFDNESDQITINLNTAKSGSVRTLWQMRELASPTQKPRILAIGHKVKTVQSDNFLNDHLVEAVNRTNDSIVITDFDGTLRYVNPAFTKITGYTGKEVIGKKPLRFLSLPQDVDVLSNALTTLQKFEPWTGSLQLLKKDGVRAEVQTTIQASCDQSSGKTYYIAISTDITRETALKQHIQETHKLEALGNLANGIAHQFNNVLASIIGFTELALYTEKQTPESAKHLERVLSAVEQGKHFVSQIMTFTSKAEKRKRPLDIVPILQSSLNFINSILPKEISLDSYIPEKGPKVSAVSDEINQLIVSLANNAIQAMKKQAKGTLGISMIETQAVLKETPSEQPDALPLEPVPCLKITVSDNGTGIEEDIQHRIFDPFYTQNSLAESSGMGLAIVHGIVKNHNGKIEFSSIVGKGTTFDIYLPTLPPDDIVDFAIAKADRGNGEMILLLDDEEYITDSGAELLNSIGYNVTTINDSQEALKLIEKDPKNFDLLITDQTMPKLLGTELIKEIRAKSFPLAIIICSAHDDVIGKAEQEELDISIILKKPCSIYEMARAVKGALDSD